MRVTSKNRSSALLPLDLDHFEAELVEEAHTELAGYGAEV